MRTRAPPLQIGTPLRMATGVSPSCANRCRDERDVDRPREQLQPRIRPPRATRQPHRVGYDCEFVERPPKAVQCECPVCLLVLREPHQVTCCGYSFCATCVKRVQNDKKVVLLATKPTSPSFPTNASSARSTSIVCTAASEGRVVIGWENC